MSEQIVFGWQPGKGLTVEVGSLVGAERWPGAFGNHPDGWGRPWSGVVLAVDDPRAWKGTIAFGHVEGLPAQEAVTKHVAWCESEGLMGESVPVAWEFGKVYWEPVAGLRAFEEDMRRWRVRKALALRRERVAEAVV